MSLEVPDFVKNFSKILAPNFDASRSELGYPTEAELGKYCTDSVDDGDKLQNLKKLDDKDALVELIKASSGPDNKCRKDLLNTLDTTVKIKEGLIAGATPSGGGLGYAMDKTLGENLYTRTSEEGCKTILYNAADKLAVTTQKLCKYKGSIQTLDLNTSTQFSVSVIAMPTESMIAGHTKSMAEYKERITEIALNSKGDPNVSIYAIEELSNAQKAEEANWDFSIRDFKLQLTYSDVKQMEMTNDMQVTDVTSMEGQMKKQLTSDIVAQLTKKTDFGGSSDSIQSYVSDKVKSLDSNAIKDIIDAANKTKITSVTGGNILFYAAGPISGVNLGINIKNMTFLRSAMISKALENLTSKLASEVIAEVAIKSKVETENAGLTAFQGAVNKMFEDAQKGTGLSSMLSGFSGLLGGLFGPIIILALIGLFIFYKLFLGGGIGGSAVKIAIIIFVVLLIYFGAAYMFKFWPFKADDSDDGKKDKPSIQFRKISNFMNVDPNTAPHIMHDNQKFKHKNNITPAYVQTSPAYVQTRNLSKFNSKNNPYKNIINK